MDPNVREFWCMEYQLRLKLLEEENQSEHDLNEYLDAIGDMIVLNKDERDKNEDVDATGNTIGDDKAGREQN